MLSYPVGFVCKDLLFQLSDQGYFKLVLALTLGVTSISALGTFL